MSCACGHHHGHPPLLVEDGQEIAPSPALVAVKGHLICEDAMQMMLMLELLPAHVSASRAEPGNLRFDLHQTEDPLVWSLHELFADKAAFAHHQSRSASSPWGRQSAGIRREIQKAEALPRLRPETPADPPALRQLLRQAFQREDEADLLDALREDGDLALSLVVGAKGVLLGHLALSPIRAPRPALALGPVAVHPAVQSRGLGSALIRAALAQFADHLIVVLGDPAYYARFGFQPVDWQSPYAGPCLQALGPDLPARLTITHAPAFDRM